MQTQVHRQSNDNANRSAKRQNTADAQGNIGNQAMLHMIDAIQGGEAGEQSSGKAGNAGINLDEAMRRRMDRMYQHQNSPYSGRSLKVSQSVADSIRDGYGIDTKQIDLRESPDVAGMGAKAVTQGNSIRFAPGMFDTETSGGLELLGHELSHVREQATGGLSGYEPGKLHIDSASETAGDISGKSFASGGLSGASPVSVGAMSANAAPIQAKYDEEYLKIYANIKSALMNRHRKKSDYSGVHGGGKLNVPGKKKHGYGWEFDDDKDNDDLKSISALNPDIKKMNQDFGKENLWTKMKYLWDITDIQNQQTHQLTHADRTNYSNRKKARWGKMSLNQKLQDMLLGRKFNDKDEQKNVDPLSEPDPLNPDQVDPVGMEKPEEKKIGGDQKRINELRGEEFVSTYGGNKQSDEDLMENVAKINLSGDSTGAEKKVSWEGAYIPLPMIPESMTDGPKADTNTGSFLQNAMGMGKNALGEMKASGKVLGQALKPGNWGLLAKRAGKGIMKGAGDALEFGRHAARSVAGLPQFLLKEHQLKQYANEQEAQKKDEIARQDARKYHMYNPRMKTDMGVARAKTLNRLQEGETIAPAKGFTTGRMASLRKMQGRELETFSGVARGDVQNQDDNKKKLYLKEWAQYKTRRDNVSKEQFKNRFGSGMSMEGIDELAAPQFLENLPKEEKENFVAGYKSKDPNKRQKHLDWMFGDMSEQVTGFTEDMGNEDFLLNHYGDMRNLISQLGSVDTLMGENKDYKMNSEQMKTFESSKGSVGILEKMLRNLERKYGIDAKGNDLKEGASHNDEDDATLRQQFVESLEGIHGRKKK